MAVRRRAALSPAALPPHGRGTGQAPLTVNDPALLVEGGDARFRRLIYDLYSFSTRLDKLRGALSRLVGLTGRQYHILLVVAELGGGPPVTVNKVALALRTSAAFVTKETGALIKAGLLDKAANPRDRRAVMLRLTPRGVAAIDALAPALRTINDDLFAGIGAGEFRALAQIMARLVTNTDAALAVAERIAKRPRAK